MRQPSRRPVHRVVRRLLCVPGLPSLRAYRVVFAYLLNVEDHHAFDRELKACGYDIETIRNLREEFRFSDYVQDFWRAVTLYLRATPLKRVLRHHPVDPRDISMALSALTEDQFGRLLTKTGDRRTYKITDTQRDILRERAERVCYSVASRKLRWIHDSDPSFDGFAELQDEAMRVINFYSHFPDPARILAYAIKAIYNKANHLSTYHSRPDRRRKHKLPEFRCPECKAEFVHEKHVLNPSAIITMLDKLLNQPTIGAECPYFCPKCAKKRKLAVGLTPIIGERVYRTTVLSLDSAAPGARAMGSKRLLGDSMADPTSEDLDAQLHEGLDVNSLVDAVSDQSADFMRILLEGDRKFEKWLRNQEPTTHDEGQEDPLEVAQHICRYLGVDYADVQREIGRPLRASVFEVQVGDEEDLVCAHTPRSAVDIVARQYRYTSAYEMQQVLGEPVKVRCVDPFRQRFTHLRVGDVVPAM